MVTFREVRLPARCLHLIFRLARAFGEEGGKIPRPSSGAERIVATQNQLVSVFNRR